MRFGVTLIGSKAMAGSFRPALLDKRRRRSGVTMRDALTRVRRQPRGDGASSTGAARNVAAYVESHIEQGPVLLDEGLPVGVVTSIAGAIA